MSTCRSATSVVVACSNVSGIAPWMKVIRSHSTNDCFSASTSVRYVPLAIILALLSA